MLGFWIDLWPLRFVDSLLVEGARMKSFKQVGFTLGSILLCAFFSIVTVGLMEGSVSVLCDQCNGHGHVEHGSEKGVESHECAFCGGEGSTYGQYNSKLYQLVFFMIYVLAIGIVTGKLRRFTVKLGPLFFRQGGGSTDIIRKNKDE